MESNYLRKVPYWFYNDTIKHNAIWLNDARIRALNPCTERRDNYFEHHKGFKGKFSDFCDLEHVTNADKKWVADRLFDVEQKYNYILLMLNASIEMAISRGFVYTEAHKNIVDAMGEIPNHVHFHNSAAYHHRKRELIKFWVLYQGYVGPERYDIHRTQRATRMVYDFMCLGNTFNGGPKLSVDDFKMLCEEASTPFIHFPDGTMDMDAFEEYCELSLTFLKMASET